MAIVSAAIVGLTAVSLAKVNHLAFNGLDSSKTALQAQQYAASKAELIRSINYDDLTAQNKNTIQNSNFQDEVKISAESSYPSDSSIKQKICTINVYKTGESLPRSTLIVTRLSTKPDSGVPKGSIIPWYGQIKDIPSGFALCNGENGTPDLRDRFLVGAGNEYQLGNSGGENFVILKETDIAKHRHPLVSKYHAQGYWNSVTLTEANFIAFRFAGGGVSETYHLQASVLEPSLGLSGFAGNTNPTAHENRPPYYALYYIMKL